MNETTRQYRISIFPYTETGGTPSSEVSLEITDGFDAFYAEARRWISEFHSRRANGEPQFLIRDGIEEDFPVNCREDEVILSLLYCCKNADVTFREIHYKGDKYTDISDIRFFMGDDYGANDSRIESNDVTRPICFRAKKNGCPVDVYFFGPYIGTDSYGDRTEKLHGYPLSSGIVEIKEKQMYYAGMYVDGYDFEYTFGAYDEYGEYHEDPDRIFTDTAYEGVHVFLETDLKNVTFSILIEGKLYKKISKDDEKVTFHSTCLYKDIEDNTSFTSSGQQDILFENNGGNYLYVSKGQDHSKDMFSGVTFTPPQIQDSDRKDPDFARRLWQDYICALYTAFSEAEEYRPDIADGYIFKRNPETGNMLTAETDGFQAAGRFVPSIFGDENIGQWSMPGDSNFIIEKASFTAEHINVTLIPTEAGKLELAVKDEDRQYHVRFDALDKRGFFSNASLPRTIRFDRKLPYFVKDIELYKSIKAVITSNVCEFTHALAAIAPAIGPEDLKKRLYTSDMIPDSNMLSFALELQNEFYRTKEIPNIALIGEAGSGKTTMVIKLAQIFGKGVLCLSPSDLKGAFEGHTKVTVLEKLVEAAENNQIFFIDEAYELMSDEFGREAIALLLPLMAGSKEKIDANASDGKGIREYMLDLEHRIADKNRKRIDLTSDFLPIWISGYEDDIRLMVSQNQGLFRRFKWASLKTPTTDELYDELIKKLTDAQEKLSQCEDSDFFKYNADTSDYMKSKYSTLGKQFKDNENLIRKFFRWGSQPQNSRYFANHAGVISFLNRCLDSIDFEQDGDAITGQIEQIITLTKRNIKRQLDTIRRKGENSSAAKFDDAERIEMVYDNKTRFADLVGCDSQITYMRTIIDMLVKKSSYEQNNITIPKGALLLGSPGVGKTFIARAMAGELEEAFQNKDSNKRVGFMSLSAPELTTKPISFIGSIFDKAEEYDVCVIFIDEVDAIAKNRFENGSYSHFIELIKQMDGIEQRSNIFVLAATNAHESLDPAFTRSGRIDKKLFFELPNIGARTELAKRYLEKRCEALENFSYDRNDSGNKKDAGNKKDTGNKTDTENETDIEKEKNTDWRPEIRKNRKSIEKTAKKVAEITHGYTPGDMENIINEAFILYDREIGSGNRNPLSPQAFASGNAELDFLYRNIYEAVERKNIGDPRPGRREEAFSIAKNDQSCSAISVHETGHALVSVLCGLEPFEKITTLPRGDAMGYVMSGQKVLLTKADYENQIRISMGGRIAEEIVYGKENISWGAAEDMKSATSFARRMVEEFGFSEEFGFMAFREDTASHLGMSRYSCSESFREQSDQAVRALLRKLYQETREKLSGHKNLIVALAKHVFENETMTGEEFRRLYEKSLKEREK